MQNQMECEIDLEERKMYLLRIHYLTFCNAFHIFGGLFKALSSVINILQIPTIAKYNVLTLLGQIQIQMVSEPLDAPFLAHHIVIK